MRKRELDPDLGSLIVSPVALLRKTSIPNLVSLVAGSSPETVNACGADARPVLTDGQTAVSQESRRVSMFG